MHIYQDFHFWLSWVLKSLILSFKVTWNSNQGHCRYKTKKAVRCQTQRIPDLNRLESYKPQVLQMKPFCLKPTKDTKKRNPLTTAIYQSTYFWNQSQSAQVSRQLMLLKMANASLKQHRSNQHIKHTLRYFHCQNKYWGSKFGVI